MEQLVEVLKERYQDGIQQPTAERVVEVPKISCQECIEALDDVSQERISEEKFEVHRVVLPEQIPEKDCASVNECNGGAPRKKFSR